MCRVTGKILHPLTSCSPSYSSFLLPRLFIHPLSSSITLSLFPASTLLLPTLSLTFLLLYSLPSSPLLPPVHPPLSSLLYPLPPSPPASSPLLSLLIPTFLPRLCTTPSLFSPYLPSLSVPLLSKLNGFKNEVINTLSKQRSALPLMTPAA